MGVDRHHQKGSAPIGGGANSERRMRFKLLGFNVENGAEAFVDLRIPVPVQFASSVPPQNSPGQQILASVSPRRN